MASIETDSVYTWLDLPPTPRQTWSAVAVVVVVLVTFGVLAPAAGRPLTQLNAFFPSLDAIVLVTGLITAVLLFAQFSISRLRSFLALACGYLFTALIVVPHALTFSGAFSPTGLLGAGLQTGSWLFIFWHIGFAGGLLAYAMLRGEKRPTSIAEPSTFPVIGWSVAGVFGLVCGIAWLCTAGESLLPPIILDQSRISPAVVYPISFAILITGIALAVLSFRRRSVFDQWLMVVALVSIAELTFSGLLPSVRFSVGFYAGRVFSLITSSIVLIVLLSETTSLYVRLARSNAKLQRERNSKLMNMEAIAASISHEVRQPLSAIVTSGGAALRFLEQAPPNHAEVQIAVNRMVRDGHRASQVFDSIGGLFRGTDQGMQPTDMNDVMLQVLRDLGAQLKEHGVVARAELTSELPSVMGHRGQLQEVALNLVQNAIDAMDAMKVGGRVLRVETQRDGNDAITVTVQDTGPGIDPEQLDSVFDAFITTKPQGMGLGLAICRMIVERHGGQLSAWSDKKKRGTLFQFTLPIRPVAPAAASA